MKTISVPADQNVAAMLMTDPAQSEECSCEPAEVEAE